MQDLRSISSEQWNRQSHLSSAIPGRNGLNPTTSRGAEVRSDRPDGGVENPNRAASNHYPHLVGNVVALDVETDGLDPYHGARIFCWSYFTDKGEFGFMRKSPEALEWVKRLFEDPTKKLVFHNAKFDLKMFGFEGLDIFGMKAEAHCTLILAKLFNGMLWSYELKNLAVRFLGRSTKEKTEVMDWLKANKRNFVREHNREPNFTDAPISLVKQRAMWDTESTLMLFHYFYPRVMKNCPELYETERQLQFVVIDMENTGIQVDLTRTKLLRAQALSGIKSIQRDLNELICPFVVRRAHCTTKGCKKKKNIQVVFFDDEIPKACPVCGGEIGIREELHETFNPNSAAIELPVAFINAGINLRYKTKAKKGKKGKKGTAGGKWCFDEYAMIRYVSAPLAKVMRESSEEGWPIDRFYDAIYDAVEQNGLSCHELIPPLIMKMRELSKMVSTYYDNFIANCVDVYREPSGRQVGTLHCKFNQSEAMSGRFSSSDPNLQNQPRILGPRECFITRRGRRNWHVDYSQVEMKLFVHFAKDQKMARAIEGDIHLAVAAEIYGLALELVTKEQRKRAKGVNFGIIYGSGPDTMAEALTKKGLITTKSEAARLVANYHRRFPSVRRITNELKAQLYRQGYVENPFGRRYYIDTKFAYTALNYMCQGTSADLMKRALVRIWKWLREKGLKSKILLTIHDEIGIEIPQCEESVVVPKLFELMEDHLNFFVPITVDADVVVKRWSEKVDPKELNLPWYKMN